MNDKSQGKNMFLHMLKIREGERIWKREKGTIPGHSGEISKCGAMQATGNTALVILESSRSSLL